ncbi:MAG: FAD-dependent oxidoreductase [Anaerolineaceae bacterium]|nr:FAD-dependent oxidoreductase [Anaerolineaceae bacterium]
MVNDHNRHVLVIGAGPAGLFAARKLVEEGIEVTLLNRDIKPGGLAEYGIYYDKYKIKEGLRKQFRQILDLPQVNYLGNVTVGNSGDVSLDELRGMGFDAILVASGAQGTKKMNLQGEDLKGVYHAKDVVYHYNRLPPYSTREFHVHGRVAAVGVGNVMMDIAHWAIHDLKVDELIGIARRGPAEVKFTEKEMGYVIANLDQAALDEELARCAPFMQAVGQDVQAARDFLLSALPRAEQKVSNTRLRFEFLASPTRIIGNEKGEVVGLEVEDNKLVLKGDETRAVGLGTHRVLNVDSVIFCIGDAVDSDFGLPVEWNEFVKNPNPVYPIDGISYEAYDVEHNRPIEGVFIAGWSRMSSYGLVGLARKDGENGVKAILEYLKAHPAVHNSNSPAQRLEEKLNQAHKVLVRKQDLARLEEAEQRQKQALGVEDFKFMTNEEMFSAMGK